MSIDPSFDMRWVLNPSGAAPWVKAYDPPPLDIQYFINTDTIDTHIKKELAKKMITAEWVTVEEPTIDFWTTDAWKDLVLEANANRLRETQAGKD